MLIPSEIQSLNQQFNEQPTEKILGWAWERFGARAAIGTSFQGAGLVMIHIAQKQGLKFPVFTLDTGLLFPETIALQKRLENFFGFKIESLEPDLTVEQQGYSRPGTLEAHAGSLLYGPQGFDVARQADGP